VSSVIAVRGNMKMIIEDGVDPTDKGAMCVLHNASIDRTSSPMSVQRALKWGYWRPPNMTSATATVVVRRGAT
jgi:hypothetical protein